MDARSLTVVASPGETLTIKGEGFLDSMSVHLSGLGLTAADQTPTFKVLSPTEATVTLPSGAAFGPLGLTASQDGNSQNLSIFSSGDKTDHPIITADATQICTGTQYYDVTGTLQTGTAACGAAIPACTEDGASGCVATTVFKAADTSKVTPSNLLTGTVLAGITGNLTLPSNENVLAGTTYGASGTGSSGSLTLPPASQVLASTSYGVGGSGTTGTLTLPAAVNVRIANGSYGVSGTSIVPSLSDCSSDGTLGCVTVTGYPSAKLANFAATDVRSGVHVAGVTGTLAGAPAACASDGATACLATASYTAAATTGLAAKVLSGNTVAGIAGNVTLVCRRGIEGSFHYVTFFELYSCRRHGGLALRNRLAGADFKPPHAARLKRSGRERCGKGMHDMSGVDWKGEYK